MINNKQIIERIKSLISKKNITAKKLAELAGITPVSIYRILNEHTRLTNLTTIQKISTALEIPIEELLREQPQKHTSADIMADIQIIYDYEPTEDMEGYIRIPLMSTKASATPAVLEISSENRDGWVYMNSKRLPKNISEKCYAFKVRGDSMEPMLQENDLVAIQPYDFPPTSSDLRHSNVYLVRIQDDNGSFGLTLKHVNYINKDNVVLSSDNIKYPPKNIDLKTSNGFRIIGRIVWMWREFN